MLLLIKLSLVLKSYQEEESMAIIGCVGALYKMDVK